MGRHGAVRVTLATLQILLLHPVRFLRAIGLAVRVGWRSDRGLLVHLVYLAEACVLHRWLRRAQINHFHAHFGTNSTTVAMFCHELGGPTYSFTCHGPEEFDRAAGIGLGEKIRRAKFVIAISHFGKSQLFRHCDKSHWNKIHIIRCGVDSMFLGAEVSLPSGNTIVCVGRLCEQKGQLLLVEAAARLAAEKVDFHLALIGDGPMRGEIQKLIDRHDLGDCVTIAGWMSNAQVRQQMIESRVVVLPSFAEGLPVVLMEALALHRPVISTFVAGIPELVENGETGWLVPAGDLDALAEALRQSLAVSQSDLAKMGAAGAEKVARLHNVDTEAAKLARLLTET